MASLAICPHLLKANLCIQCKKYELNHRRIESTESKNAFDSEEAKDEDNDMARNEMISIDMNALPINMNILPIEICFSFNTSTGIGLFCVYVTRHNFVLYLNKNKQVH